MTCILFQESDSKQNIKAALNRPEVKEKIRQRMKNMRWYTNGTKHKLLNIKEQPPKDWIRGMIKRK